MPTVDHIGVSRKIPSDEERLRLKRILQANRTGIPGGYIVRTAGEGRSEEELRADMMFLYNLWLDMRQKAEQRSAPALIHHDLNVVERILRDQLTTSYKSVWVDNEEVYESVLRFVQRFQPALVNRVKLYTRSTPIFDEFGVTAELEKALRPKVWLKSGGYIVINQTEALVAIDINTGKYVGKSNRLEDTIVKTNTDAIKEIVRQIRLRDLGGIIVVDFIDMDERKNRQKVMQALEEAMRADRAPYKILQFNDFGLVAITRKRVKQSLERTLCTPCPYCEGAGYVKSPQTVVGEILQEAHKIARAVEGNDVMLRVAPEVAKVLKSNQNTYLQEIEEILGRTVIVKSDPPTASGEIRPGISGPNIAKSPKRGPVRAPLFYLPGRIQPGRHSDDMWVEEMAHGCSRIGFGRYGSGPAVPVELQESALSHAHRQDQPGGPVHGLWREVAGGSDRSGLSGGSGSLGQEDGTPPRGIP